MMMLKHKIHIIPDYGNSTSFCGKFDISDLPNERSIMAEKLWESFTSQAKLKKEHPLICLTCLPLWQRDRPVLRFEHFKFARWQVKKQNLKVLKKDYVWRLLRRTQEKNMRKFHHSIVDTYIYEDMKERCIIFHNDTEILVFKGIFDKMVKIYSEGKSRTEFFNIKKFNPIVAMFMRNQVSEC